MINYTKYKIFNTFYKIHLHNLFSPLSLSLSVFHHNVVAFWSRYCKFAAEGTIHTAVPLYTSILF